MKSHSSQLNEINVWIETRESIRIIIIVFWSSNKHMQMNIQYKATVWTYGYESLNRDTTKPCSLSQTNFPFLILSHPHTNMSHPLRSFLHEIINSLWLYRLQFHVIFAKIHGKRILHYFKHTKRFNYTEEEREIAKKSTMEDETRVATARVRTTQTLVFSNHKQTPTRYSINNTDCARKQWQTIDVFVSYDNLRKMGQKPLVKYEISFFIVLLALQCYEWRFDVIFTSLFPLSTSGHDDSSILATFSK